MERYIPMLWILGLLAMFIFAITGTYQIGYYSGSAAGFIAGFKDRTTYYEKMLHSNGFYVKDPDPQDTTNRQPEGEEAP